MTKPNPHRLIDPTKNEEFKRQQKEREEQLKEMLQEVFLEKTIAHSPSCENCRDLKNELDAALERERELQREVCVVSACLAYHLDTSDSTSKRENAKQRGWPEDLFDGEEGE